MELVAQGVGNMGSVLFGGIPATGAIARTAANVKSGGRTPVAGMVHALVLLVVLVFLMPYAALIPMPTIAAILLQVAYNMTWLAQFRASVSPRLRSGAVATLLLTFVLTIVFDLVTAIAVGMLITVVLFMKMVSEETEVKGWTVLLRRRFRGHAFARAAQERARVRDQWPHVLRHDRPHLPTFR